MKYAWIFVDFAFYLSQFLLRPQTGGRPKLHTRYGEFPRILASFGELADFVDLAGFGEFRKVTASVGDLASFGVFFRVIGELRRVREKTRQLA